MKRSIYLGALAVVLVAAWPVSVVAQTAISADGVVESTTGGFKFPDGTVQATAAAAGSAPVEDTGQDMCWDPVGMEIECLGTGQDGEHQAGVDWPAPRFTINESSPGVSDGTVTDNLTGLVWLQVSNCFSLENWTDALSIANGLADPDCLLTDGSVGGEWRLPNIKELLSLVDYSQSDPALPSAHPFINVESGFYWSSTTLVSDPPFAWVLDMLIGQIGGNGKPNDGFVWPVRAGQ